jgi:hypothetical protein
MAVFIIRESLAMGEDNRFASQKLENKLIKTATVTNKPK